MKQENSEYISITQMAKLRNVTTETLRHYDRIDLLKPDHLDKNRVRYYSVLQYEKLGTIRELEQIGLSLKEIKEYLDKRNLSSSYELLKKQEEFYVERIKKDQAILNKIQQKHDFIDSLNQGKLINQIQVRQISKRMYLKASESVNDEISLAYQCMQLEKTLNEGGEVIPIFASDRYAGIFPITQENDTQTELIVLFDKKLKKAKVPISYLPEGKYLCFLTHDSFWKRDQALRKIRRYAQDNNLKLSDQVLLISRIDYSVTNDQQERMVEYQVRLK